jgi:hypothetical protein
MCWREARRTGQLAGFLDPALVNETTLRTSFDETVEYILQCLLLHQDKEGLLLPLNQQ